MAHLLHNRECLRHFFSGSPEQQNCHMQKNTSRRSPAGRNPRHQYPGGWRDSARRKRAQQCPHKVSSTISSVCLHRTAQVYEQLFSLRVALYTASGAAIRNPRPCILSSCSFPIFASAAGVAWKPATLGPFSEKAPSMTEISPSARTAEAVPQYAPPQQPACPANPIP